MELKTIKGVTFTTLREDEFARYYTSEQAKELFTTAAALLGDSSGIVEIYENHAHEHLSSQGGAVTLRDFVAKSANGAWFLNLGCCFFTLESAVTNGDETFCYEFIQELQPETCAAQPLIMKNYSVRVTQKIKDAKNLAEKQ